MDSAADAKRIVVLLIEDSSADARLIQAHLEGDSRFSIVVATRLNAGLRQLEQGGIDVVLLDLNLPDSSGVDTFSKLSAKCSDIPVVILTGFTDPELETAAVRLGAQDYLPKNQLGGLSLSRSLLFAVERNRRRCAEDRLRLAQDEFDSARKIQEKLLPLESPRIPGFDIAGACHPAAATGGDYFDYLPMKSGSLGIVVADVSGHGFAPALIMAGTRRVLRTLADTFDDIGEILTVANRAVIEDTHDHHFVTVFFAKLEPSSQTLVHAGAGHVAYLLQPCGDYIQLQSTGFPLGTVPDAVITAGDPIPLSSGQMLLLLTDGLQEAQSPKGTLLGIAPLLQLANEHRHESAQSIIHRLFEAVRDFCHPLKHQDDVTAVVVKVGN